MIKIFTPIYKKKLDEIEKQRIDISLSNNSVCDHIFIAPENLDVDWYKQKYPLSEYITFKDEFFDGISGYNKLMLASNTYLELERVCQYSCILQTDAILLRNINDIKYKEYDYIGSGWPTGYKINFDFLKKKRSFFTRILTRIKPKIELKIGNGGLSIRNNQSFRLLALLYESLRIELEPEDVVFSYLIKLLGMRVPDIKEVDELFAEWAIVNMNKDQISLLFGVHGIDKVDPNIEWQILNRKF